MQVCRVFEPQPPVRLLNVALLVVIVLLMAVAAFADENRINIGKIHAERGSTVNVTINVHYGRRKRSPSAAVETQVSRRVDHCEITRQQHDNTVAQWLAMFK